MMWLIEWLPYYNDLNLGGHLACAFMASILSGCLLFGVNLAFKDMCFFARSYAFSIWSSALIWVFPMFFTEQGRIREFLFYITIVVSVTAIKYIYGYKLKKSLLLWVAFLVGQALVFFMIYKKVF